MNVTLVSGARAGLGGRLGIRVGRGRRRQTDRVEDAHAPQRRDERAEAIRHDHVRPAGRLGRGVRRRAATGSIYVRFRVTAGTAAQGPELKTVFGRDYVERGGTFSGVIPAFDYAADANDDGYLNDAEYANRRGRARTPGSCTSRGCSTRSTGRCGSSPTRPIRTCGGGRPTTTSGC